MTDKRSMLFQSVLTRFRSAASFTVATALFVACGDPLSTVGAPCAGSARGSGEHCTDATHMLTCRDFTWREDVCRGPNGCAAAHCDQRVAEEGDACETRDAQACSVGGTKLLRCDEGSMTLAKSCCGDRGCFRDTPETAPACDVGQPEVGDACDVKGARCSADGRSIIACQTASHRYATHRYCHGPKGCFDFSPYAVAEQTREKECFLGDFGCDSSVGEVGDPCGGATEWGRPCLAGDHCPAGTTRVADSYSHDGWPFCSGDGKQELTCKNGMLVPARSCARCSVVWTKNEKNYSVVCEQGSSSTTSAHGAAYVTAPEHS